MDVNLFFTSVFTPAQLQLVILVIKIAVFVISGFLLGMIIFALAKTSWLKFRFVEDFVGFFTYKPYGAVKFIRHWEKIVKRLEVGSEDEYKRAVLEAEEMLNNILEKMGYSGENLKERLEKVAPTAISNRDQIYQAHLIRNNIVHDPDYRLTLDQAKKTLDTFEQALRDLQVF